LIGPDGSRALTRRERHRKGHAAMAKEQAGTVAFFACHSCLPTRQEYPDGFSPLYEMSIVAGN
jgi:hypothetical protein